MKEANQEASSGIFGESHKVQWGESSPAKHGEAYFSAVVWPRILAITGEAIEKPYALHNSLGIHLARTFGATGKEQPSPPLHLAAAARLLSCRALRWCSCICLAQLVSISQFLANHISCLLLRSRVLLTEERLNSNSRVAFDHQIVIIIIKIVFGWEILDFRGNFGFSGKFRIFGIFEKSL